MFSLSIRRITKLTVDDFRRFERFLDDYQRDYAKWHDGKEDEATVAAYRSLVRVCEVRICKVLKQEFDEDQQYSDDEDQHSSYDRNNHSNDSTDSSISSDSI